MTAAFMNVYLADGAEQFIPVTMTASDTVPVPADKYEISLGSINQPGPWRTPDLVSVVGNKLTVSVLVGATYFPTPARYYPWLRLTVGGQRIVLRSTGRVYILDATGSYQPAPPVSPSGVIAQATPPDPLSCFVWFDTSTVPPVPKYYSPTGWLPLPGGSGSAATAYGAGIYGAGVYGGTGSSAPSSSVYGAGVYGAGSYSPTT